MIIATAGHVDHGKTTLIRALTGVDTDRLPEEKKRGLSIDLGFAYLPHPAAEYCTLGFIDVPGHEKFVRNMIAGVGAVDLALLIVAADDGPMPQTREHLAILQLLGVKRLIVVVTKTDLVEETALQQVKAALKELLSTSPYSQATFFSVSAETPASTDNLRTHLLDLAVQHARQSASGYFRLAIDRCFSVTGAGTVVTGTVLSGTVKTDDTLQLLSSGASVRVRGIRAQDTEATVAAGGQRCALNITGSSLRNSAPKRGDWLTANPLLEVTAAIDVHLSVVGSGKSYAADANPRSARKPFRHWTSGHLHLATASTTCRVALLNGDELPPGQSALARIYCDKPIAAVTGDRFVLRDQSAKVTIAGGSVIDPLPPGRGRSQDARLRLLAAMHNSDPALALSETLSLSSAGIDLNRFIATANCTHEELSYICKQQQVVSCQSGGQSGGQWWGVGQEQWRLLQDNLLAALETWHQSQPLLLGASPEQLQKHTKPGLSEAVLQTALQALIACDKVVRQGAIYRCKGWTSALDDTHETHWSKLSQHLQSAGLVAPRVVEIAALLDCPSEEVLKLMNTYVAHGRLYRVSANRYYLPETLQQLATMAEALAQQDNLTVAAYRDQSAIGRNLVIELLEFFDRMQFTRRNGQHRSILQPAIEVFATEG